MLGALYHIRYDQFKRSSTTKEILILSLLSEKYGVKFSSSYYTSFTSSHDVFLTAEVLDPIPDNLEIDKYHTIAVKFSANNNFLKGGMCNLTRCDFQRTITTQFRDSRLEKKLSRLIRNRTRLGILQTKFRTGSRKPLGIYQPTEIYFAIPHIGREEITIQEFENLVKNSLEKIIELSKKYF